ncbi:Beta-galactosidase [Madurella mycetomatis]|uniref:Beta-galactosidase n=1 Tax=Madurella mycetomatis TaxID=100816 RepID=A0A175WBM5_9PEZI|nr:Beta-galactosidase [Madurella mycetomatis]
MFDPTDDQNIPQAKQAKRLSHIFHMPCSGIWQTVWLESVPKNHISDLNIAADIHGNVTVAVHSSTTERTPVEIYIAGTGGEVIAQQQHTPESPTLYNITVNMGDDEVKSYTGFRTISSGVVNGVKRPLLNGEFLLARQHLHPPTPEAMIYDLEVIKSLDNHHYAEPHCGTPWHSQPNAPYDANRIGLQGEFGRIGLRPADENLRPIEGAIRTINETYEIHAGIEPFHYRAHVLLDLLRQQVERYACSGAVYTQTTDVEGEVNGLMTYDRRVVRVDVEKWKEDIRALYDAAKRRG